MQYAAVYGRVRPYVCTKIGGSRRVIWPGVTQAHEVRIFAVGRDGAKRMGANGNLAPNDLKDKKIVYWANSWRGEVNKIDP